MICVYEFPQTELSLVEITTRTIKATKIICVSQSGFVVCAQELADLHGINSKTLRLIATVRIICNYHLDNYILVIMMMNIIVIIIITEVLSLLLSLLLLPSS